MLGGRLFARRGLHTDTNKRVRLDMKKYNPQCKFGTYDEAKEMCAVANARLCTVEEVKRCKTCFTGCGFDWKRIWTNEVVAYKDQPVDGSLVLSDYDWDYTYPPPLSLNETNETATWYLVGYLWTFIWCRHYEVNRHDYAK